jgi:L,D-transpeptidase YcbB
MFRKAAAMPTSLILGHLSRRRFLASFAASIASGSAALAQDSFDSPFAEPASPEITGSITSIAPRLAMQGKLATETEIVGGRQAPIISLGSISALQQAIETYEGIVAGGGWPTVEPGRYTPDKSHPRNFVLRQRLVREAYLPFDAITVDDPKLMDEDMTRAVMSFQLFHGIAPTGKLDERTIAELNISAEARLFTLRENLPRIREHLARLGPRAILVNIPSLQLETVELGKVYSRHNIVVGKLERPTPSLKSKVTDIVFNPFWNAPASIVARDIIPKFMEDPSYLDQMQIRVFNGVGGPEINPHEIDWYVTPADRYHFQQQPGAHNSLASVKVNFANKHMVYLHDTPHRELFGTNARFESSGCVRVDKVREFTTWILDGQDGFDAGRFEMIAASEEHFTTTIPNGPDIRIMYLTAWATEDGSVNFRPDVYALDGKGFVLGQPEPVGEEM